ncbi:MAG: hypothetical protein NC416_16955 [Eubacterium sp.]|nr:hypothetical protein [Eubacterium sp.]
MGLINTKHLERFAKGFSEKAMELFAQKENIPTALPANGGNADTVNSHHVNADVPSNAKFTDTVYTHPTASGNKHIPAGGSQGQILRWSADGTAVWGSDNNTTYSVLKGATASGAGTQGLVPAPAAGKQSAFLRGDGTWAEMAEATDAEIDAIINGSFK